MKTKEQCEALIDIIKRAKLVTTQANTPITKERIVELRKKYNPMNLVGEDEINEFIIYCDKDVKECLDAIEELQKQIVDLKLDLNGFDECKKENERLNINIQVAVKNRNLFENIAEGYKKENDILRAELSKLNGRWILLEEGEKIKKGDEIHDESWYATDDSFCIGYIPIRRKLNFSDLLNTNLKEISSKLVDEDLLSVGEVQPLEHSFSARSQKDVECEQRNVAVSNTAESANLSTEREVATTLGTACHLQASDMMCQHEKTVEVSNTSVDTNCPKTVKEQGQGNEGRAVVQTSATVDQESKPSVGVYEKELARRKAVEEAYKRGEKIEYKTDGVWYPVINPPLFFWEVTDYRIAPKQECEHEWEISEYNHKYCRKCRYTIRADEFGSGKSTINLSDIDSKVIVTEKIHPLLTNMCMGEAFTVTDVRNKLNEVIIAINQFRDTVAALKEFVKGRL